MFSCIVNSFSFNFSFGGLFDWSNASDSTTKKTSSVWAFFTMSSNESAEPFNQDNHNTFGSVYLVFSENPENSENKGSIQYTENPLNLAENRNLVEVIPSDVFKKNKQTQYGFFSKFINWL